MSHELIIRINGVEATVTEELSQCIYDLSVDLNFDPNTLTPENCVTIFQCIIDNGETEQFVEFLHKIDFSMLMPEQCQHIAQCVLDNLTPAQITQLTQTINFSELTQDQCDALAVLLISGDANNAITIGTDGKLYVAVGSMTVDITNVDFTNITPTQCLIVLQCIIDNGSVQNFIDLLHKLDLTQMTNAQCQAIIDCVLTQMTPTQIAQFNALVNPAIFTPQQCIDTFQCICDNATSQQFSDFLGKLDFTQLTAAQCQAIGDCVIANMTATQVTQLQTLLGPVLTVNAGTTALATDDSLGSEDIGFGDIVHFWSNDGSIMFGVTAGSAVVEAHLNPTVLAGIAHTAITGIDLQATANDNEYTVVLNWVDADGNAQVTQDPTPILITGATNTNYANTNLLSNGNRTHTWTHNQREEFDGGTHVRTFEISAVLGTGNYQITESSDGFLNNMVSGNPNGISWVERLQSGNAYSRVGTSGAGQSSVTQADSSYTVKAGVTNTSEAPTGDLELSGSRSALEFTSGILPDGTKVGVEGKNVGTSTELFIKTGDVGRGTAQAGHILRLVDPLTGEAEYGPGDSVIICAPFDLAVGFTEQGFPETLQWTPTALGIYEFTFSGDALEGDDQGLLQIGTGGVIDNVFDGTGSEVSQATPTQSLSFTVTQIEPHNFTFTASGTTAFNEFGSMSAVATKCPDGTLDLSDYRNIMVADLVADANHTQDFAGFWQRWENMNEFTVNTIADSINDDGRIVMRSTGDDDSNAASMSVVSSGAGNSASPRAAMTVRDADFDQNAVGVTETAIQLNFQIPGSHLLLDFNSGNAGQYLGSNGVGQAPTWQDIPDGITPTSIDLSPTGNVNEYTVTWTYLDTNGNSQTLTDATPVTISGGATPVQVNKTPLTANPTATGNTSNLNSFVSGANGRCYFIDANGDAKDLGGLDPSTLTDAECDALALLLVSSDDENNLTVGNDGKLFVEKQINDFVEVISTVVPFSIEVPADYTLVRRYFVDVIMSDGSVVPFNRTAGAQTTAAAQATEWATVFTNSAGIDGTWTANGTAIEANLDTVSNIYPVSIDISVSATLGFNNSQSPVETVPLLEYEQTNLDLTATVNLGTSHPNNGPSNNSGITPGASTAGSPDTITLTSSYGGWIAPDRFIVQVNDLDDGPGEFIEFNLTPDSVVGVGGNTDFTVTGNRIDPNAGVNNVDVIATYENGITTVQAQQRDFSGGTNRVGYREVIAEWDYSVAVTSGSGGEVVKLIRCGEDDFTDMAGNPVDTPAEFAACGTNQAINAKCSDNTLADYLSDDPAVDIKTRQTSAASLRTILRVHEGAGNNVAVGADTSGDGNTGANTFFSGNAAGAGNAANSVTGIQTNALNGADGATQGGLAHGVNAARDAVALTNFLAVGQRALRDASGNAVTGLGDSAGQNNTGSHVNGIGDASVQNNTGSNVSGIGRQAGRNNSGDSVVALGELAGSGNTQSNRFIVGIAEMPQFADAAAANAALPASGPNGIHLYIDLSDNTVKARI